jgi:DNA-binding NarL/FixJ family response regulator
MCASAFWPAAAYDVVARYFYTNPTPADEHRGSRSEMNPIQESAEPQMCVRILVVDDNAALRNAVGRLIKCVPGMEVCGEAENGREAIQRTIDLQPDVVLMDIGMPDLNGLEATRKLRKVAPRAEVLVFTEHESTHAMQAAMDAGARGYLAKTHAASLVDAVKTVARHRRYSSLARAVGAPG